METRVRRVLLTAAALLALPGCATVQRWRTHRAEVRAAQQEARREAAQSAADGGEMPPPVIRPEVVRRHAKAPQIRSSNVEIGADFGVLSIEDFGSHPTYGIELAYHVTEDFFLADPIMALDRNPVSSQYLDHVFEVREGARGATGGVGGGCGCN